MGPWVHGSVPRRAERLPSRRAERLLHSETFRPTTFETFRPREFVGHDFSRAVQLNFVRGGRNESTNRGDRADVRGAWRAVDGGRAVHLGPSVQTAERRLFLQRPRVPGRLLLRARRREPARYAA